MRALEFIRMIIGHDALASTPTPSQPGTPLTLGVNGGPHGDAETIAYATSIRRVISEQGWQLLTALVEGLVTTFPPDQIQLVVTLFRVLVSGFPRECLAWIGPAVEALPSNAAVGQAAKARFLQRFQAGVEQGNLMEVKHAVTEDLYRASIKSRERSRVDRLPDNVAEGR